MKIKREKYLLRGYVNSTVSRWRHIITTMEYSERRNGYQNVHSRNKVMVELQHTTFGITGKIFCMETLFSAYENDVDLDLLIAYKATKYTNTMYLY